MEELNGVIDLSHHNGQTLDFRAAAGAGILAVVHKATQGSGYTDPMYVANRSPAQGAGLYWGAYHFGVGADGVEQADFFLTTVKPDTSTLLALDFEANPTGPSMTLEEARAFVTHIYETLSRWPVLYAGHYLKEILQTGTDPVLANCPLWLAQYGPTAVVPPNWKDWTLWQYTDGGLGSGPHDVPGIGRCDRDKFNGDPDALKALWGVA